MTEGVTDNSPLEWWEVQQLQLLAAQAERDGTTILDLDEYLANPAKWRELRARWPESNHVRWQRLWTQAMRDANEQGRNDIAIVFAQLVETDLLVRLGKDVSTRR